MADPTIALEWLQADLILPRPASEREPDEPTYTAEDVSKAYQRGKADAR